MLINYQLANGEVTQIDVSDEVGEFYLADLRDETNNERRETRRHNSLGRFFVAEDARFAAATDVERSITESDAVRRALAELTDRQRYLLAARYLDGKNFSEIAKEEQRHPFSINREVNAAIGRFQELFNAIG